MGSCTDFNTCTQSKFSLYSVLVVLVSFSKHLNALNHAKTQRNVGQIDQSQKPVKVELN